MRQAIKKTINHNDMASRNKISSFITSIIIDLSRLDNDILYQS